MPSVIGNDALSFIYIPRGFQIELREHTNLEGRSRSYGSKDYGINLSLSSSNDAVSSFIIRALYHCLLEWGGGVE